MTKLLNTFINKVKIWYYTRKISKILDALDHTRYSTSRMNEYLTELGEPLRFGLSPRHFDIIYPNTQIVEIHETDLKYLTPRVSKLILGSLDALKTHAFKQFKAQADHTKLMELLHRHNKGQAIIERYSAYRVTTARQEEAKK